MKKLGGIITIFLLTLALISPASATELFQKDLKYGTTNNSEVKKLQQYLKDKNYYSGPISGNYYGLTRTALMKLQKSYGLKQTGKFDSVTRNRLNKTLALMIEVEDRTKELEELQESQRLAELDKIIKAQLAATQVVQQPVVEQPRTEPIQEPQTQSVQPTTQSATQPTQPEQPTQQNNQTTNIQDIIPPKVILSGYTNQNRNSIILSGKNTYGNVNNICTNCISVETDEPTTIKIEYLEWFDGFEREKDYPEKTLIWTNDGKLSTSHILMLKLVGIKPQPTMTLFRYSVKDAAGNETKQEFTGSAGVPIKWSNQSTVYDPNLPSETIINNVKTTY